MITLRYFSSITIGLVLALGLFLAGCDSGGSGMDDPEEPNPPSAPTGLDATVQDGAVDLSWSAVDQADAYNVYRSSEPTDEATGTPLQSDVSSTSYEDGSVSNGQTYYYRVTAVSDTFESAASSEVEVEIVAPPGEGETGSWTRVRTESDNTIYDVAQTSEGAYAVAAGGQLLKREQDTWAVVLSDGPSGNSNDLYGLAVTDDGNTLWFAGASGALGEYDVTTGDLVQDRSGLNGTSTNNFRDVAVTGQSGSATVQIVDDAGKVYSSTVNGGGWNTATPGSGAVIRAIDTYDVSSGYIVDDNQSVFETTDSGNTWSDAGIADANVSFYGVDADASDDVWVVGGSGMVYRWDGSGWTPNSIGEPTLRDIEVGSGDASGLAVGGSGALFEYDGSGWTRADTPTSQNLRAVIQGDDSAPSIAVGAAGTILEK